MTNIEHEIEEKQTNDKCFCHSKWFKKFILIFLSVYLGVLGALCTFCAFHKPKMPPFKHHKMMYKIYDKDFDYNQAKMIKDEIEKAHKDFDKEMQKIREEFYRDFEKRD